MKHKARTLYSEDDLLWAVADVKNGIGSHRVISKKYDTPIATLSDKIKLGAPLVSKIGK